MPREQVSFVNIKRTAVLILYGIDRFVIREIFKVVAPLLGNRSNSDNPGLSARAQVFWGIIADLNNVAPVEFCCF